MRSRFNFSIAGIYFDLIKCKIILKRKFVLLPSFMADTKIIFGFNFVAPLRTKQDFFLEIKKYESLLKSLSDDVKLQISITGQPLSEIWLDALKF